jgi:hypothetical protein
MARCLYRLLISLLSLALLFPAAAVAVQGPDQVDLTGTEQGIVLASAAAARFSAAGHPTKAADLVVTRYADGSMTVGKRGTSFRDLRAAGDGWQVSVAPDALASESDPATTSTATIAAAPYWAPSGDGCFASLFRGTAHFDTCYGIFKMANDGSSTYDYWRVDFNGTMFAEGRKLKWGWIAVDRDAGPAQSFTTNGWSPVQDITHTCQAIGVGVTVLGVGASHTYTQCESWNISKSSGSTLGYFKNEWSWGNSLPLVDRDRAVALMIGTRGTPGSPTFGLSWDFAIY